MIEAKKIAASLALAMMFGLSNIIPSLAQTYTIRALGPAPIPPTFSSVGKAVNIKDEVLADGVFGLYSGTPSILLPIADYGMPAGLDYLPFYGFTNFTGLSSPWVISVILGYLDVPFRLALNDQGQILGTLKTPSHAGVWQNRRVKDLGTLGGPVSIPFALNQNGDVIGYSSTANGNTNNMQPFMVLAGSTQMQPLAGLDQGANTTLIGFNNQRQILATAPNLTANRLARADLIWQNGVAQEATAYFHFSPGPAPVTVTNSVGDVSYLYPAGTYNNVNVRALNDLGEILGYLTTTFLATGNLASATDTYHSFIYSPSGGRGLVPGLNYDVLRYETPSLIGPGTSLSPGTTMAKSSI